MTVVLRSVIRGFHDGSDRDDRKEATDRRSIWEDLVTPCRDGVKPHLPLQESMIDMMRIIVT